MECSGVGLTNLLTLKCVGKPMTCTFHPPHSTLGFELNIVSKYGNFHSTLEWSGACSGADMPHLGNLMLGE